jgi:hypothetical protein
MDSAVCVCVCVRARARVHALHKMWADFGLWPGTCHTYDNPNVNKAVILCVPLAVYVAGVMVLLGTVLCTFVCWCLYSFLFETSWGWRHSADTLFKTDVQFVIVLCASVGGRSRGASARSINARTFGNRWRTQMLPEAGRLAWAWRRPRQPLQPVWGPLTMHLLL